MKDLLAVETLKGRYVNALLALGVLLVVGGMVGLSSPLLGTVTDTGGVPDGDVSETGSSSVSVDRTEWEAMMADKGFQLDHSAATTVALEKGRPLLLYFGSPNCHWCRRFHRDILSDSGVRTSMQSYVPLAVQLESGSQLLDRYGVRGTPTVVLVDPGTGAEFYRLTGYPNPDTVSDPATYFSDVLDGEHTEWAEAQGDT